MPSPSVVCPECNYSFAPPASVSRVSCPICDTEIPVVNRSAPSPSPRATSAVGRRTPVAPPPSRTPAAPPPAKPREMAPVSTPASVRGDDEEPAPRSTALLVTMIAVLLFLVLGAGMGAYVLSAAMKAKDPPVAALTPDPKPTTPREGESSKDRDVTKDRDVIERPRDKGTEPKDKRVEPKDKGTEPKDKGVSPRDKEPRTSDPAVSKRQAEINIAIDKGTVYLKSWVKAFHEDRLKADQYKEGVISLMGLTLLECGVPADDPSIQKIAVYLRERAPKISQTYCLTTAIFFLDRLGNPRDRDLVQTFALRLIAGQNSYGSWTYGCPILSKDEEEKLLTFLKTRNYADPDNPSIKDADFDAARKELPSKLRELPVAQKKYAPRFNDSAGDNSNTQFGLLALWIAKRQGVPVQPALGLVDKYFRTTQNEDGSWGYGARTKQWRGSMTCAGLLGLAVGRTLITSADGGQVRDPNIEKGFAFLATQVAVPKQEGSSGKIIGADAHGDLYYLWSLERVAMVYDLKKIGGKDWYEWASGVLLDSQKSDGSWAELYPGAIDTCFALLVLKRVNVAKDLTTDVKKVFNIKDLEK